MLIEVINVKKARLIFFYKTRQCFNKTYREPLLMRILVHTHVNINTYIYPH